jgi:asparaginyl-tRNA synthetase
MHEMTSVLPMPEELQPNDNDDQPEREQGVNNPPGPKELGPMRQRNQSESRYRHFATERHCESPALLNGSFSRASGKGSGRRSAVTTEQRRGSRNQDTNDQGDSHMTGLLPSRMVTAKRDILFRSCDARRTKTMPRPDTMHAPETAPASSPNASPSPSPDAQAAMATITIEDAGKHDGQEVTVRGWLYNLRESGKLLFPIFRDGTGIIQGVVALKENPEAFEALKGLTQESSVIVTGKIRAEQRAPGGYEIGVGKVTVVQKVSESQPYPIQLKEHGVDFLLDNRHLWMRTPRQAAILRIRAEAERAARNYMDSQGYTLTDAPMFTPAACEGTSTLFEVNYIDDQKAYLSQSGQLYIEATAMALGKVYTFGPTFRAEKSKTRRHLTEFWMLEPEAAYADLNDMMALGEGLVSAIVQSCLKNKSRELETLKRDTKKLENVKPPFPRVSYEDALKVLQRHGNPSKFGDDIGGDEETIISNEFDRPVMVHRYPAAIKAFYMQPDAERPDLALAFDMLAPEGYGEIIGGSQRIHDYDLLVERLREHNLPEQSFQWYLDLRRYGSVPHAGFGMGLERTVAWICGTEHIREVIPFPRMLYRVYP